MAEGEANAPFSARAAAARDGDHNVFGGSGMAAAAAAVAEAGTEEEGVSGGAGSWRSTWRLLDALCEGTMAPAQSDSKREAHEKLTPRSDSFSPSFNAFNVAPGGQPAPSPSPAFVPGLPHVMLRLSTMELRQALTSYKDCRILC